MTFFSSNRKGGFLPNGRPKQRIQFTRTEDMPAGAKPGRVAFVADGAGDFEVYTMVTDEGWVQASTGDTIRMLVDDIAGVADQDTYTVAEHGGVTEGATVVGRFVLRNGVYQEPSSGKYTLVAGELTVLEQLPVEDGEIFTVVMLVND